MVFLSFVFLIFQIVCSLFFIFTWFPLSYFISCSDSVRVFFSPFHFLSIPNLLFFWCVFAVCFSLSLSLSHFSRQAVNFGSLQICACVHLSEHVHAHTFLSLSLSFFICNWHCSKKMFDYFCIERERGVYCKQKTSPFCQVTINAILIVNSVQYIKGML